jgi:hypothetical protein
MARYIDADAVCEALKSMASVQLPDKQSTILGVVSSIENFPTADVAPRAEVAREIFGEIEKILDDSTVVRSFDYGRPYFAISKFKTKFTALKNKYTEPEPPRGEV